MDIFIEGTAITKTQPNITSLGVLSFLEVQGFTTFTNLSCDQINSNSLIIDSVVLNPVNIGLINQVTFQNTGSINIGYNTGITGQGSNAISIGLNAGVWNQGENSIAIGINTSQTNQGSNSIAIGNLAGSNQAANSIVINSSGSLVTGSINNATYIAPVRQITQTNILGYNTSTFELSYFIPSAGGLVSERIRIPINNDQASFNTNVTIKWTGTAVGSLTGLSNNTSSGIVTLNNTGIYYFFVKIKFNSSTSGNKSLWFPNSIDNGQEITDINFATVPRYAKQDWTNIAQFFTFNYALNITNSDLPFTFCLGWNQTATNGGALAGTVSDPNDPTNLIISRIIN